MINLYVMFVVMQSDSAKCGGQTTGQTDRRTDGLSLDDNSHPPKFGLRNKNNFWSP